MAERFTGQSNAVMGDVGSALALDSHASPRDTEADGGVTVVPPSSLMLHPRRTTDGRWAGACLPRRMHTVHQAWCNRHILGNAPSIHERARPWVRLTQALVLFTGAKQ